MGKAFRFVIVYIVVLASIILLASFGSRVATNITAHAPLQNRRLVIIDAGHGGVDGGAISCTGVLESEINLSIATRLNDLLNLLGIATRMIRTDDRSIYTSGDTIAAKKISDLKERVRIVNASNNAILVSIHQNFFPDSQYYGAQVFYAETDNSKSLARCMQDALKNHLNQNSNRTIKAGDNIYLLEKIDCTGILIECGFLSNPVEEAKLRDCDYQKNLCCIISAQLNTFLSNT